MAGLKPNILNKVVGTAGTAVQLSPTAINIPMISFQAKSGNTGKVFIGDSGVNSSNGIELMAGDVISLAIDGEGFRATDLVDLTSVWIDSEVSGEGITAIYLDYV